MLCLSCQNPNKYPLCDECVSVPTKSYQGQLITLIIASRRMLRAVNIDLNRLEKKYGKTNLNP